MNTALAASRMGGDTLMCARVGADSFGNRLIGFAKENGIDTRLMTIDKKRPTGLAAITVEADGTNRITVYKGANEALGDDDLEEAFMCYPDAVMLQFETNDYIVKKTIEIANEKDIPVIVDAGPARADYPLFDLGRLKVFSPNENETFTYTGIRPDSHNEYVHAVMKLAETVESDYYVLKLGGRGCYISDGKFSEILPAYNVEVVDTTAAGDAFTAAMTVEYIRTGDIIKACRYANAVGALTVSKRGSSASIPSDAEARRFMETHKIIF